MSEAPDLCRQWARSFGAEPDRRRWAESFGSDPERYDRARPRYPDAMIERIVAGSPGRDFLDVGCGTGIASRQFAAAGCRVLGVDVDARMADVARAAGLPVEVAAFEDWDPAGRAFDAVVSAQTWHWIDPVAGAAKSAQVLAPDGRLAAFWNVGRPSPEVAEAFGTVYRRVMPGLPYLHGAGGPRWTPTRAASPEPPTGSGRPARSASPSSGDSIGSGPTHGTSGSPR